MAVHFAERDPKAQIFLYDTLVGQCKFAQAMEIRNQFKLQGQVPEITEEEIRRSEEALRLALHSYT